MRRKRSAWLASAAKGATGRTFEIRTIADFLQVPENRRRICLREFSAWLASQEAMTNLLVAVGASRGTPLSSSDVHWDTSVFRWEDDGKATIRIHMGPQETETP